MKFKERWKKAIVNKWLVYEKGNQKHYFLLISIHPKVDYAGKIVTYGNFYNAYHAMEIRGSVFAFKFVRNLPADLNSWGKCSYLNDAKLLKKLNKKMTKSLLRGEDESDGHNPSLFGQVFGTGEEEY